MKNMMSIIGRCHGFTMLELLMVVIIIGVLATLAVPQYMGFVEKARATEAVSSMSALRTAQNLYKLENGEYSGNINKLAIEVPTSGSLTYWNYNISGASDTGFSITATRTSKKAGAGTEGQTIVLNWNDKSGESWSGEHAGVPR